jgi:hypothetical protein
MMLNHKDGQVVLIAIWRMNAVNFCFLRDSYRQPVHPKAAAGTGSQGADNFQMPLLTIRKAMAFSSRSSHKLTLTSTAFPHPSASACSFIVYQGRRAK